MRAVSIFFLLLLSAKSNLAKINPDNGSLNFLKGKDSFQFTENKGQIVDMNGMERPDILYFGEASKTKIYLRKTGLSYVIAKYEKNTINSDKQKDFTSSIDEPGESAGLLKLQRVDLDFIDCNKNATVSCQEKSQNYFNYYLGNCPKGITNVYSYNKVIYHNIYPNVDVAYYGETEKSLKYDIVVNPGGDPKKIKIKYSGAENATIINGSLNITTQMGEISEHMPKVFQNINGKIVDVPCRYNLVSQNNSSCIITFEVAAYQHDIPLIIDPFSTWSTYWGGSDDDTGNCITTDAKGDVVVTGFTESTNFPVAAGYQMINAGPPGNAFVSKFEGGGTLL